MDEYDPKDDGTLTHLTLQALIYVAGLIAMAVIVSTTPADQKVTVLGIMITAVLGGQNLVKTRQGSLTDRKVEKDIKATESVAKTLNGGFNERVKSIVKETLVETLPEAISVALEKRAANNSADKPKESSDAQREITHSKQ